jgi:hypothetical protein
MRVCPQRETTRQGILALPKEEIQRLASLSFYDLFHALEPVMVRLGVESEDDDCYEIARATIEELTPL